MRSEMTRGALLLKSRATRQSQRRPVNSKCRVPGRKWPPRRLFGRQGSARHAKARYITYYVIFLSAGATVNWTKLTNYTPDDQEERVDPPPSPAVFRHFRRVCLCFGLFPLISPGFRNKEKHVKTFPKNRKNSPVTQEKKAQLSGKHGSGKTGYTATGRMSIVDSGALSHTTKARLP